MSNALAIAILLQSTYISPTVLRFKSTLIPSPEGKLGFDTLIDQQNKINMVIDSGVVCQWWKDSKSQSKELDLVLSAPEANPFLFEGALV